MDFFDITSHIEMLSSNVKEGIAIVHVKGATPGLLFTSSPESEIDSLLSFIVPLDREYEHGNAYAHLRSTILSTTVVIPINNGKPITGARRVYILEIEPKIRSREIIITIVTTDHS